MVRSSKKFVPDFKRSRDRAGFQQCLFFPQLSVAGEVLDVAVERCDQRSRISPGAQTHVDAIKKAARNGIGQATDQLLANLPVTSGVVLRNKNEVDV